MGPLFFILCIHVITKTSNALDSMLLANDAVFVQNEKKNKYLYCQKGLKAVVDWLNKKTMTIICKKKADIVKLLFSQLQ